MATNRADALTDTASGQATTGDQRAFELMQKVDPYGPMHIVVDDGNLADGNLDFVEELMRSEGGKPEEWELLGLLRAMSEDDRFDLWEAANG